MEMVNTPGHLRCSICESWKRDVVDLDVIIDRASSDAKIQTYLLRICSDCWFLKLENDIRTVIIENVIKPFGHKVPPGLEYIRLKVTEKLFLHPVECYIEKRWNSLTR